MLAPHAGSPKKLGAAFAQYEMKIALGALLGAHRFALADDAPVVPVRRNITFGPKGGVRLLVQGAGGSPAAPRPSAA